jgi:L-serine kinase (ATP) / ParB family transcriptional regulator, heme-responsive regulator
VIPALGRLQLVELSRLVLHEAHDPVRLGRVQEDIRRDGVQRNPVVVASCEGLYLVLDGAHRVHALRELDVHFALVQCIDLPERAASWGHLLDAAGLEARLRSAEEAEISEISPERIPLATACFHAGRRLFISSLEEDLASEVRALWALQEAYPPGKVVRRVDPGKPVDLPSGEAILLYRRFTPGELLSIVSEGEVLPAGITRFIIEERVLNVRYPLALLAEGDFVARNAELEAFIGEAWQRNRVRRYAEPVVLFE